MIRMLGLLATAACLALWLAPAAPAGDCCSTATATCDGSSPCKACRSCKSCKHCKGAGTCGTCK